MQCNESHDSEVLEVETRTVLALMLAQAPDTPNTTCPTAPRRNEAQFGENRFVTHHSWHPDQRRSTHETLHCSGPNRVQKHYPLTISTAGWSSAVHRPGIALIAAEICFFIKTTVNAALQCSPESSQPPSRSATCSHTPIKRFPARQKSHTARNQQDRTRCKRKNHHCSLQRDEPPFGLAAPNPNLLLAHWTRQPTSWLKCLKTADPKSSALPLNLFCSTCSTFSLCFSMGSFGSPKFLAPGPIASHCFSGQIAYILPLVL